MLGVPKSFRWVYLLPIVHLFVSLISMIGMITLRLSSLGVAWSFTMLADLPISLVAYMVAWKYSWLAALWIIGDLPPVFDPVIS